MHTLCLGCNVIGDEWAIQIANCLLNNKSSVMLDLTGNNVESEEATQIANSLCALFLECNDIGSDRTT